MGTEFDAKYDIIHSATPRHIALSARYKKSFAYYSLRERLPVFLTQIMEHLKGDKKEISDLYNRAETLQEIKHLRGLLSKLQYQLQTDKKFEKFCGQEPDKELWNNFIDQLPTNACSFFTSAWLYAECYFYRKVASFFENTKTLRDFDYFAKEKQKVIKVESVLAVAKALRHSVKDFKTFDLLIKLNLWGNKIDLCVPENFKPNKYVFEQLQAFNKKILVNNSKQIWQCLNLVDPSKPAIVDIITDNAGFELFTDFMLADYLIDKELASKVRFSIKPIPWHVTDVVSSDIAWILDYLGKQKSAYLSYLATKWKEYFANEKFIQSPVHYFWVSPYEYYKMREIAPGLYQYLSKAQLVIFKGDLNYRKLLGGINWDPTEEFITCLRGFLPTNTCSLRTLKSDLICGLPQGKAEELQRLDSKWLCSGEYGVIHFLENDLCSCNEN